MSGERAGRDRLAAERHGRRAETWAALLLRFKGYRILDRRFRCPRGEVDLVAMRGRTIVFVEVKARDTIDDAAHAVNDRQRGRIEGAASVFLQQHPETAKLDVRFDAILVSPGRMPRHLPDAWRPA